MKIEVGMKLHVRADLHVGMNVRYSVSEGMENLAGKEVTVSGVRGNRIEVVEDNGRYAWSFNMFSEFDFWIKGILEKHKKWLKGEDGGERADMSNKDISGADMRGADMRDANMRGADMRSANMTDADMRGADMRDANMRDANMRGADMTDAVMTCADMRGADMTCADMRGADMRGANMTDAFMTCADMRGADMRGAFMTCADMRGADMREVKADERTAMYHLACPEEGAFIGFKKCNGAEECVLVKLEIPEDAKRSSATTRKCRCSKAKVISITGIVTGKEYGEAFSKYNNKFVYRVGETVVPDNFNEDRWKDCSNGIHFFITKQEAIDY